MRISHDCFANFVADFRTKFVRVSHECREDFHVSRTRRELVAKVLNMFENFMRIFSPKYFARLSRTCRREILANLQCQIFATLVRMACECRTKVARQNVVRHSHECRVTVVRIKMKISYIRGKVVRHSHECRATVARQSRDIFLKLDRNSRICRINVYSMRLQRESCVYIVNLCREIVANCSLKLVSHWHANSSRLLREFSRGTFARQISESEKLLGVHINNSLSRSTHIDSTLKKCNSLLFLLNRIKKYLNIPTRKLFYNAYILPHLDYCCSVWGNANTELMTSIIKFQKRAVRSILDKPIETPSEELFAELKWMTFPERVMYQKAILMYKIMHNLTPAYLTNMFTFSKEVHDRTQQTIFCTSQNQILNIIETALHTQDQKYGTPFQTISEMQSPFNNLGKDILNGQPHKNILYFRNRTLFCICLCIFSMLYIIVCICCFDRGPQGRLDLSN